MAFRNVIDAAEAQRSLSDWLSKQLPEANGVRVSGVSVSEASGMSCQTVLFDAEFETNGGQREVYLVARVAPDPAQTDLMLFPDYDLELEASIMRALGEHTEVPTPKVLFTESEGSVLGGPFLIMERASGQVPPDDPPYTRTGWVLALAPRVTSAISSCAPSRSSRRSMPPTQKSLVRRHRSP